MEMLVSLSHEIRVEKQDAESAPPVLDAQQQALDAQEQQRIISEYGIDATKEEIAEKEQERIKKEQEEADEKKVTIPADLGQRKPKEDSEQNGSDIQNEHDDLTKL